MGVCRLALKEALHLLLVVVITLLLLLLLFNPWCRVLLLRMMVVGAVG